MYYRDSPYAELNDGCDVGGTSAYCGDYDESVDRWDSSVAELQVTKITGERSLNAQIDVGDLAHVSGTDTDSEGTITASFAAQWCEIE